MDWGHKVTGLVLGYDQNVLIDSMYIKLQNRLLNYHQPFHCSTSVEHLGLDCKVRYTNANQGIMPESHDLWVEKKESEENHLDKTFQGLVSFYPEVYDIWTPLNQIFWFRERLPARNTRSTWSKRCNITQQCVLHPQAEDYVVFIPILYNDLHSWADCVDEFIWVVKLTN